MSKHRVAVLKVVAAQLSVTDAAAECGISRQHLHRLLRRYREGGLDDLGPRSRRPKSSPQAVPDAVRDRILALRMALSADGLDAGPATIAWHLEREGLRVPSVSTIRRILHAAGLVVPEPHKRPRSSWIRFEAAAPNEVWQSDFTHWQLAGGSGVEIISWLDDHSRYLLGCTVFRRVSGDDVVATFTAAGDVHGWPAATLTDNGAVYTSRFTGGRNGYEYLLAWLGVRQKNGAPGHPQTQGKVERFQQTLKRWLGRQPAARDLAGLQAQLDTFRRIYNEERPHRAIGRRTPAAAYAARVKAHPSGRGTPGPLPSALRHHRWEGSAHPPARGPHAPPQGRRGPRPHAGARHRRRAGGHGRRPRHGPGPRGPPGRARQGLLAQHATGPRPMAGIPADRLTPVSPMTRLMCHRCRDSRHGAPGRTRTPNSNAASWTGTSRRAELSALPAVPRLLSDQDDATR
jgi:transposase InsO family protein